MKDTFTKFSANTADEIVQASFLTATGGSSGGAVSVDPNKLVAKLKQFFPNIIIATQDIVDHPTQACAFTVIHI